MTTRKKTTKKEEIKKSELEQKKILIFFFDTHTLCKENTRCDADAGDGTRNGYCVFRFQK